MKKFSTVKNFKIFVVVSALLIIVSIFGLSKGFEAGIDFKGGMLLQVKFENTNISLLDIENYLDSIKTKYLGLSSNKIQISENTFIIKTPYFSEDANKNEQLKKEFLTDLNGLGKFETIQISSVGATIGKELLWKAINALVIASIGILIYIAVRFKFSYALGGIASLIHDVIIAAGMIALFKIEIDSTFIAALLTIIGYSINDTIVVYDRIRENENKHRELSLAENIDLSVVQVLGRSINTSMTVLFALITLYIFGGDSLKTFTTTLLIGITVGTYSSIFVATPVMYLVNKKRKTAKE